MSTLRPVVVEDVLARGPEHPLRPVAEQYGMRGCILLPLIRPTEGTAFGVLTLGYTGIARDVPPDIEFLQTAAAAISGSVTNAMLFDELRVLNERLEERVAERTAELMVAQEQLLLAGRLTAMGELAGGVAHELNTPLGTIIGYTQFAEERLLGKEGIDEVTRYLGIVRTEADRCTNIVRNLLQFARASSAAMVPVDVGATVQYAVDLVLHHMEMNHVRIELSLDDDLPQVLARSDQLVQVFTNLMINAQQAMPGGGDLVITARPAPGRDGMIAIEFADSGAGISSEHLGRVFEPFFTTKPVGQGTGLGLAVSYSLVQQHAGDVEVESGVGVGTTMRVLLPLPHTRDADSGERGEAA